MAEPPRHRVLVQCLTIARSLTREPWQTVYTLAETQGVSVRTVLRYLQALREAGIIVEARPSATSTAHEYRVPRSAWRVE